MASRFGIPIVLVGGHRADNAEVVDSVMAGTDAVLHGDGDPDTVLAVLAEVSGGGSVMNSTQMRAVAGLARAARGPASCSPAGRNEILGSIAEGKAVKRTARDLGISPRRWRTLRAVCSQARCANRAQAVARAHGLGLF